MVLDKELLEILACPKCKKEIGLTKSGDGIVCESCKLVYPIRDGIPVMLIDEAEELKAG
ncbi:MAG: Trm112 family protein [Thermodesulfobacteriota bacterium]